MKRLTCNIVILIVIFFISCNKEDYNVSNQNGILKLSLSISDKINVVESRSLSSSDTAYLANDCRVRIYDSRSLIRKYEGIDNVPSSIVLPSGNYSIRVTAGDSTAASFKKKFFEGKEDFSISYGKNTELDVDCRILNTVVTVTWDESLKKAFSDYKVTVSSTTGKLVYTKDSIDASGYFCVPDNNRNIFLEFEGKPLVNEEKFILRDTLLTKKSTQYILKYRYNDNYISGGGKVDVSVDENPLLETSSNVDNQQRASIFFRNNVEGTDLPVNEPVYLPNGLKDEHSIWVSSKKSVKSFTVAFEDFSSWGLESQYELIGENNLNSQLLKYESQNNDKGFFYRLELTSTLMEKITSKDGEYNISVKVVDVDDRVRTETINIVVSSNTVETLEVNNYDVWAKRATLRGRKIDELKGQVKFGYRIKGTTDWSYTGYVNIDNEDIYSIKITELEPNSTYEYQIIDEGNPSNNTKLLEFKTEEAKQLPNSSFEDWTEEGKTIFPYSQGGTMFWDSGNTGSSSFGGNITTSDSNIKKTGNCSAKLSSKIIVSQFAAGNIFAGKFIKVEMDGFTGHGVLGFGRSFESRPSKLRGYIKYNSGTVDKGGSHISNGSNDNGIVYVALTDGDGVIEGGETWSCVVKTKSGQYFNKNAENIIAYGEKIWTESTAGDDMILFEIPLDYRSMERIPNRIIVVASASRYGDYFEGSSGSIMWLDDIELIYE